MHYSTLLTRVVFPSFPATISVSLSSFTCKLLYLSLIYPYLLPTFLCFLFFLSQILSSVYFSLLSIHFFFSLILSPALTSAFSHFFFIYLITLFLYLFYITLSFLYLRILTFLYQYLFPSLSLSPLTHYLLKKINGKKVNEMKTIY